VSIVCPCTEPSTFEPTCETTLSPEPLTDPFFDDHDRCFRLGCIDVDVPFVDAYFTMRPNIAADERHVFVADTEAPAGTSSYAENPLIRWIADVTNPDAVTLHADVDIAHVFEDDASGESVVVDHSGTIDGAQAGETITLDVDLVFPQLAGAIAVHVQLDANDALIGTIDVDGAQLATLDATVNLDARLPFVWPEACE
jgi:hypothetical protein